MNPRTAKRTDLESAAFDLAWLPPRRGTMSLKEQYLILVPWIILSFPLGSRFTGNNDSLFFPEPVFQCFQCSGGADSMSFSMIEITGVDDPDQLVLESMRASDNSDILSEEGETKKYHSLINFVFPEIVSEMGDHSFV